MDQTLEDKLNLALAKIIWDEFMGAATDAWNCAHALVPMFPAWDFTGLTLIQAKALMLNQINAYFPSQGDGDHK